MSADKKDAKAISTCRVCPRHCRLKEGDVGFCGARQAKAGEVISISYNRVTAIALDPIEKKPLSFFRPGEKILSVGSFGCNMACPFCQNFHIAARRTELPEVQDITSEQLITLAKKEKKRV